MKNFNLWSAQKQKIDSLIQKTPFVKVGDLWWFRQGVNVGFEMDGKSNKFTRPCMILHKLSNHMFLIAPLTSKEKIGTWFCKIQYNNKVNYVCLHQIRVVDYRRLDDKITQLDIDNLGAVLKKCKQLYFFLNKYVTLSGGRGKPQIHKYHSTSKKDTHGMLWKMRIAPLISRECKAKKAPDMFVIAP